MWRGGKYCGGPISRTGPLSWAVTLRQSHFGRLWNSDRLRRRVDLPVAASMDWVEHEGRTQGKMQN